MNYEGVRETAEWLMQQTMYRPAIAVVLGSGLGD